MINGNEATIHLFEKAGDKLNDTEVKALINNTLPKVRNHLDSAKSHTAIGEIILLLAFNRINGVVRENCGNKYPRFFLNNGISVAGRLVSHLIL
jgi:Domain of unknown function (DUF4142)